MLAFANAVLDGRSTRIVGAFTAKSAVNGVSVLDIGGGGAAFAASVIGQATRAALNHALKQTAEVLKHAPRQDSTTGGTN